MATPRFCLRSRAWLFVLVSVVTITSCGQPSPADSPSAVVKLPTNAPEAATRALLPTGVNSPSIDEIYDLPDLEVALAALDSYRLEMVLSFVGQDGSGRTLSWGLNSQIQVSRSQAARRFDMSATGLEDDAQLQALRVAQIGRATYLAVPQVGCLSVENGAVNLGQVGPGAPTTYLGSIIGAELAGVGQSFPGILYHFDREALSGWPDGPVAVDGQLYVDGQTGLPVHIELQAIGTADYLEIGRPQTGTLQVTVDIRDANNLGEIQPPEECQGDVLYPMVSDASSISAVDEFVSYNSSLPFDDIVGFYQTQMPIAGWVESEDAVVLDANGPAALLTFERQGNIVTVSIDQDLVSGISTVLITP